MGTFSIWHWLIVLAVVLILFGGGGKLSRLMGDFGTGLKSFKKGMGSDDAAAAVAAAGAFCHYPASANEREQGDDATSDG